MRGVDSREALDHIDQLEMVGRGCDLLHYDQINIPAFQLRGPFIAYSSPDSTYAVTKKLIHAARRSVLIGIYDFTASYIRDLLLAAKARGVKVSLMLDLDNRSGETELYDDLLANGCECVPAPSCASRHGAKYFPSCHEKVIVIDDEWTLVQSGNYSENSVPLNETDGGDPANFTPGNRDMGVAIRSKKLASFFSGVLLSDMALEMRGEGEPSGLDELAPLDIFEAAPTRLPKKLFPSSRFVPDKPVKVTPILSPDNYMNVTPQLLASASKSILVEQQYIRGKQDCISSLLQAIGTAMKTHAGMDVRIIVARPFFGKSFTREAEAILQLGRDYGLTMDKHVRLLDPSRFVHCHNKLIVVDRKRVLIGSQNWSDTAVTANREAGVLLEYPAMAQHYAEIFDSDWETALRKIPAAKVQRPTDGELMELPGVVRLNWGDYVWV